MVNLIVVNLKPAYLAPGEGGLGWLADLGVAVDVPLGT